MKQLMICAIFSPHQTFHYPLPLVVYEKLLLFHLLNIWLDFEGIAYRHIDGMELGSPLGPTIADLLFYPR